MLTGKLKDIWRSCSQPCMKLDYYSARTGQSGIFLSFESNQTGTGISQTIRDRIFH